MNAQGTTANGVITADDQAAANAKAEQAALQKDAIALDRAIDKDLKKISDTVQSLAQKLAQMKRSDAWKLVKDVNTGKPFTSFAKYLESKQDLLPNDLGVKTRKAFVAEMVAYGLSISDMVAATGKGRATIAGDAQQARGEETADDKKRKARTDGEETAEQAATKALKSFELALGKVNDAMQHMTPEQLDAVVTAGRKIANQAAHQRALIAPKPARASRKVAPSESVATSAPVVAATA
ncbi:hypothetical protein SEA_RYADEL_132 [Mycobacterium phage Ryadel]|uniref:Uncharacterized protein n=1 Tax=Mycobacterium phage Ryadel TaxID=2283292 RepID=A0A345MF96_9CAUD|nr:hypothetical protein KNU03_gp132 [Mycobacterium phage Ryadel]AXH69227.1 hypothetical protein SEA_RYADEL_132 [Mycobacterium phage Ryadel]